MQYMKRTIGRLQINPAMKFVFEEGAGSLEKRAYIIEVLEQGLWHVKHTSYIKNMDIPQVSMINRWLAGSISTEEFQKEINR